MNRMGGAVRGMQSRSLILVHFEIISGAGNSASGVMEGVSAISKVVEKLPGPLKEVTLMTMTMMMLIVDNDDGDYDDDHDDTKRGSLGDGVVQGQQDSHRQLCVQAALPGILEGEDFFTSVDVKVDLLIGEINVAYVGNYLNR